MPNSREVINLAKFMENLNRNIDIINGNNPNNGSESSMDEARFAEQAFNRIKTHYKSAFNNYGLDDEARVNAIFVLIKKKVLKSIIADDDSVREPIKNWLRTNIDILSGAIPSPNSEEILTEARRHLSSFTSLYQTAWRNFDPNALLHKDRNPIHGIGCLHAPDYNDTWINLFVGNTQNFEFKELLAYAYLAMQDEDRILDEHKEVARGNFIGQLADIRRAHHEDDYHGRRHADCPGDSPSCTTGTKGRLYRMLFGHQLRDTDLNLSRLPELIADNVITNLNRFNFQNNEKIDYFNSLTEMQQTYLDVIISDEEEFSDHYMIKRLRILEIIGIDINKLRRTVLNPQFENIYNNNEVILVNQEVVCDIFLHILELNNHLNNSGDLIEIIRTIETINNQGTTEYLNLLPNDNQAKILVLKIQQILLDPILNGNIANFIQHRFGSDSTNSEEESTTPVSNIASDNQQIPEEHPQVPVAVNLDHRNSIVTGYNPANADFLAANLREIFHQNLRPIQTGMHYNNSGDGLRLISNNNVNDIYNGPYGNTIHLPNIPVIHPYHVTGSEERSPNYYDFGHVSCPIAVRLPSGSINNLPAGITELLVEHNIDINQLEIGFCVQNTPWRNADGSAGEELLLRPHTWLHRNAPMEGRYSQNEQILVGITDVDSRVSGLMLANVHTHQEQGGLVAFSPDNMQIQGLNDLRRSHGFYSICIEPTTRQAILTLHWLLSEEHYEELMLNTRRQAPNSRISLEDLSAFTFAGDRGWFHELDFTPVDALRALCSLSAQPDAANVNVNQHYRIAGQQLVDTLPTLRATAARRPQEAERNHSEAEEMLIRLNRNITSELLEREIIPQLTDLVSQEIIEDPIYYNNSHAIIYNRDSINNLFITVENVRNILRGLLTFIDLIPNYFNLASLHSSLQQQDLIAHIEQNASQFLGDRTINEILNSNPADIRILEEILDNAGTSPEIRPQNHEQLVRFIIAIASGQAVSVLQNSIRDLGDEQAHAPNDRSIIDRYNIRSGRLFMDVILRVVQYWRSNNSNAWQALNLDEDLISGLNTELELLNNDNSRLNAVENALIEIRNGAIPEGMNSAHLRLLNNYSRVTETTETNQQPQQEEPAEAIAARLRQEQEAERTRAAEAATHLRQEQEAERARVLRQQQENARIEAARRDAERARAAAAQQALESARGVILHQQEVYARIEAARRDAERVRAAEATAATQARQEAEARAQAETHARLTASTSTAAVTVNMPAAPAVVDNNEESRRTWVLYDEQLLTYNNLLPLIRNRTAPPSQPGGARPY